MTVKKRNRWGAERTVRQLADELETSIRRVSTLIVQQLARSLTWARLIGGMVAVGVVLVLLLCAKPIAELLQWPVWSGFALVGLALASVSTLAILAARQRAG
jgi:uncharacterized membrane protein